MSRETLRREELKNKIITGKLVTGWVVNLVASWEKVAVIITNINDAIHYLDGRLSTPINVIGNALASLVDDVDIYELDGKYYAVLNDEQCWWETHKPNDTGITISLCGASDFDTDEEAE